MVDAKAEMVLDEAIELWKSRYEELETKYKKQEEEFKSMAKSYEKECDENKRIHDEII